MIVSLCVYSLQLLFLEVFPNAVYGIVSPVNCQISFPIAKHAANIYLLPLVIQIVSVLNQALNLK